MLALLIWVEFGPATGAFATFVMALPTIFVVILERLLRRNLVRSVRPCVLTWRFSRGGLRTEGITTNRDSVEGGRELAAGRRPSDRRGALPLSSSTWSRVRGTALGVQPNRMGRRRKASRCHGGPRGAPTPLDHPVASETTSVTASSPPEVRPRRGSRRRRCRRPVGCRRPDGQVEPVCVSGGEAVARADISPPSHSCR